MSLTVVGSIAYDSVETPAGTRPRMLGGAATHCSLASSFFTETRVVGPIGDDFGDEQWSVFRGRGVLTDDVVHTPGGKTMFWSGRYERDVNIRHTLETELNTLDGFSPTLSPAAAGSDVLFLANMHPASQLAIREQCPDARFVGMDSMDLWIDIARDDLVKVIGTVDALIINDSEIKQLTDEVNLVRAGRQTLEMGPSVVVAKQGEYGAVMFTREGFFALPAYPTPDVLDPTGAGDSFAGGFMGTIAAHADSAVEDGLLRRAMAYGTVMGSFNVESFGTDRVAALGEDEIEARVAALADITRLDVAAV